MTTYPNLNNEPEMLKIKTRDDEIKNLKHQSEKHDHENILKSHKLIMNKMKRNITSNKKAIGERRSRESPWTLRYPGS